MCLFAAESAGTATLQHLRSAYEMDTFLRAIKRNTIDSQQVLES